MKTTTIGTGNLKRLHKERGILPNTWASMRAYTGRQQGKEIVPDLDGDILCFDWTRDGKTVGTKYRSLNEKRFWVKAGSRLTMYGLDEAIREFHRTKGSFPFVICEGEYDMALAIQAGFPAMSVPNGAPPPSEDAVPYDAKGLDDKSGAFTYMQEAVAKITAALSDYHGSYVVIATDSDEPGNRLAAELSRRLDQAVCWRAHYGLGKDLGDVHQIGGDEAVMDCLSKANRWPLKGIRSQRFMDSLDLPDFIHPVFGALGHLVRPYPGAMIMVTGRPGNGKSSFVNGWVIELARRYQYPILLASFESTGRYLAQSIRNLILQRNTKQHPETDKERAMVDDFTEKLVRYVVPAEDRGLQEDMTPDWLSDRIRQAVRAFGTRIVVIDPWSQVVQNRGRNESETDFIKNTLRKWRSLAQDLGIILIIVAHPSKPEGADDNSVPKPNEYAGSAHWHNAADIMLAVHRPQPDSDVMNIYSQKIRMQPEGGTLGVATLYHDNISKIIHEGETYATKKAQKYQA